MRLRLVLSVIATLAPLGIANPASSSTIDQQQLSFSATTGFRDDVQALAQTFTVGVTGELSTISVILASPSQIALNLLAVSAGLPTTSILATAISNPPSFPGWTTFDFSASQILVYSGELLAFQPSTLASDGQVLGINIAYGGADPYTRGELFFNQGTTAGWQPFVSKLTGQGPIGGIDAAFLTQVSATPLPPTWTMMLIGLAGFGFVAYRRRAKPALMAA